MGGQKSKEYLRTKISLNILFLHRRIICSTIDHASQILHNIQIYIHMRPNIIPIKLKEIESRLQFYMSVDTFID